MSEPRVPPPPLPPRVLRIVEWLCGQAEAHPRVIRLMEWLCDNAADVETLPYGHIITEVGARGFMDTTMARKERLKVTPVNDDAA